MKNDAVRCRNNLTFLHYFSRFVIYNFAKCDVVYTVNVDLTNQQEP